MASPAAATLTEMLDALPEALQDRAVEHRREYIHHLRDDAAWDRAFERTKPGLGAAARRARAEIARGLAAPLASSTATP